MNHVAMTCGSRIGTRSLVPNVVAVLLAVCTLFIPQKVHGAIAADSAKHWVGTWAAAAYIVEAANMPPSPGLTNNTLRQVVRVSIGGDTLRLKLSNANNTTAVTLQSVNIAVAGTASSIDASTIVPLKFNGSASTTMSAGGAATSDPVAFKLTPNMRVAITIHYGATSSNMTGHVGSRTDSYILQGEKLTSADFAGKVVVAHWYSISAIDVLAPKTSAAVAVIGNSITDGYGLSGGLNNRWTDALSESLLKNSSTQDVGVLNLGIGATTVLGGGKTTGESRFQRDVLEQSGVAWVILFYGVNDIGGNASATNIIAGLKRMATSAKAKGLKVYGATITPFGGNSYYSVAHENARRDVNAWIRKGGDASLDGLIDLDKAIRNTSDTTKLKTEYSNDWLHPNAAGYKALGQSVDVKLFETPNVGVRRDPSRTGYALMHGYRGPYQTKMLIPFQIPGESHVSLKVYSVQGKEIAELAGRDFAPGLHTLEFDTKGLGNGVYMYSLQAGGFSASRKMYVP